MGNRKESTYAVRTKLMCKPWEINMFQGIIYAHDREYNAGGLVDNYGKFNYTLQKVFLLGIIGFMADCAVSVKSKQAKINRYDQAWERLIEKAGQ